MTTSRQIQANRANAQNSTGPQSTAGRARASRNARTHGLTAALPWPDVLRWYQVILDDPDASPDARSGAERRPKALQLAEAEAHLERCKRAERAEADLAFKRAMDGIDVWRTSLGDRLKRDPVDVSAWTIWIATLDGQIDRYHRGAIKLLVRTSAARPVALHRRLRTLQRYRQEAEARRRKALRHWIETSTVQPDFPKQSQFQS